MVNVCENGKLVINGSTNGKLITIKPTNGNSIEKEFVHKSDVNNGRILPQEETAMDSFGIHSCAVVLASATINGTIFGVVNSFGVLYVNLIEMYKNQERVQFLDSLIAGVGSLCVGLIFLCSIIASILADRYGIQRICFIGGLLSTIGMYLSSLSTSLTHLYITYGVILGIGASLAYAPSLVILGHYFKRRLGLVNGIVTAGSAIFTVIMPILLKMLIDSKGIQSTLEYLSILMSVLMICALTFKENKSLNNITNRDNKKCVSIFNNVLWRNKLYLMWAIAIPVALFGYFVPFVHLVKHANDVNSPQYTGEILVTCIGAFSCLGRFITGPIADFSNVNRIVLQQIAFISIGFLTILLTIANDFCLLLICCALGIFDGCFISLLGPIAFDLVGAENASQAIGLLLCFCSLPLTMGPPIAAYLYDIKGNYKLAFTLAGIPPIIGALLMIYILKIQNQLRSCPKLTYEETKNINGIKASIFAKESNHNQLPLHLSLVKVNDDIV